MTGGDIDGLRNLAETLAAYVPHVRDLTGRLSAVARNLTEDGRDGWHGAAATAFTATWRGQARSAAALEDYVAAVAGVIGELASELSRISGTVEPGSQARAQADAAREAAARRLRRLHQQVTEPGSHPDGAMAALLAGGLLASPVSALGRNGHAEAELSRLVDTPVIGARAALQGTAALGRHAAGSPPGEPPAAGQEPEALKGTLGAAEKIPMLDVAATLAGAGVGSYYDIKDGQSPGAAIGSELISNGAGTVAADAGGGLAGVAIGARLGAAGGPVSIAAGAVIGYGVGDLTHNLLDEHWSQDLRAHGVAGGALHGAHHAADQTADDARELAVHAGHQAGHYWDGLFG
ncbi:MAG: hypothetical protein FWE35_03335 [Streptosporangiales bacterium]|nr:hypothetical protein [Streptosporangiales bacterium]